MVRRIRKTGELVDVLSWSGNTTRSEIDCVSYVDSKGIEHNQEKLNFYWDLIALEDYKKLQNNTDDSYWEKFRNEVIKSIYASCIDRYGFHAYDFAIEYANDLIKKLKSEKDGGVQGV